MNVLSAPSPVDDPVLREALKRCSPATYYAACKYRASGRPDDLQAVVQGIVERFVDRDRRALLAAPASDHQVGALRLREDLGLDSLAMMEVVMLAEEVLGISVGNDDLAHLQTLGEAQRLVTAAVEAASATVASGFHASSHAGTPGSSAAPVRANQAEIYERPLTRLLEGQVTPA